MSTNIASRLQHIGIGQRRAGWVLANHKAQCIERPASASGMERRDAAGVARDHAAEIGKRRSVTQLLHQHAIRSWQAQLAQALQGVGDGADGHPGLVGDGP